MMRYGSQCGGSQRRSVSVPPRFGAWPNATRGVNGVDPAAATSAAAETLPASHSRRVRDHLTAEWIDASRGGVGWWLMFDLLCGPSPLESVDNSNPILSHGCQENTSQVSKLFHPGRQVCRLPHRRVVHMKVVADRTNDYFPGIQPHTDSYGDPVRAEHALGIPFHRFLHSQRGIAGALSMVLVGKRRAEERHDAVAHDLVHRTLVAVDGLHHVFDDGIEELAGFFWVAVGE